MSCQMDNTGKLVWVKEVCDDGSPDNHTDEVMAFLRKTIRSLDKSREAIKQEAEIPIQYKDDGNDEDDNSSNNNNNNNNNNRSLNYTITIKCILVLIPSVIFPLVHLFIHYFMKKKMPLFFRTISKHAYTGVIIWFAYIIVYQQKDERTDLTDFAYYLAMVFVLTGYLFVVWESLSNSTEMRYLNRTINNEGKGKYIEHLVEADPSITLRMECFRMEKSSRLNSQRNIHGHVRYHREAYYKGSVTWRGVKKFNFKYCKDLSSLADIRKSLKTLQGGAKVVRLQIDSKVKFADRETALEFKNTRDTFVEQNKHHDKHYRFWVEKDIPDLQKEWLYYTNELPLWMSVNVFVACSFLWLSWPYRILFNLYTTKTKFKIVKSVSNQCPIVILDSINTTAATATMLNYNKNNEISTSTLLIGPKDERSNSWLLEEPPTYDESIYFKRASSPKMV